MRGDVPYERKMSRRRVEPLKGTGRMSVCLSDIHASCADIIPYAVSTVIQPCFLKYLPTTGRLASGMSRRTM